MGRPFPAPTLINTRRGFDEAPRGKTCQAIMGIIEERRDVMKEFKGAAAFDPGLLAAAQAVRTL